MLAALTAAMAPADARAGELEVVAGGPGEDILKFTGFDESPIRNVVGLSDQTTNDFPNGVRQWVVVSAFEEIAIKPSAAPICEYLNSAVRCRREGLDRVAVNLGRGPDEASNASRLPSQMEGGEGDDDLWGASEANDTLLGGDDADSLDGGRGADELHGGDGDDELWPGVAREDNPFGGAGGSDEASDVVKGGDGNDQVHYDVYNVLVHVSLNNLADDGFVQGGTNIQKDRDNINDDVEVVHGTRWDDELTGSAGSETLEGYIGNDTLRGEAGAQPATNAARDTLRGGPGADTLWARDHLEDDVVACGTDSDTVHADTVDPVDPDCETKDLWLPDADRDGHCVPPGDPNAPEGLRNCVGPADDCDDANGAVNPSVPENPNNEIDDNCDGVLEFDRDNDGYNAGTGAGRDCDDQNAAVRPDAPEDPYNEVDDNCDGTRVFDLDRDHYFAGTTSGSDCDDRNPAVNPGVGENPRNEIDDNCDGARAFDRDGDGALAPPGPDCDDGNAAVHPGRPEIPQNGRRDDCAGDDAPFPPLPTRITIQYKGTKSGLRVSSLVLTQLLAGSRVEVRCKGRSCPKKRYVRNVRREAKQLKLQRRFRRLTLRPGAVLEVRVVKAELLGRVRRDRIRRGRAVPSHRCLDPRRVGQPVGTVDRSLRPRPERPGEECS